MPEEAAVSDASVSRDGPTRAREGLAVARVEVGDNPGVTPLRSRRHAKGKLTVQERLTLLLDRGRSVELETFRRQQATGFGLESRRPYTGGVATGWRNVAASGVIPQISVVLGFCAGGAAYSPALTDFVFMVRDTSPMFLTGPDIIRAVTSEEMTAEELGGTCAHSTRSGVSTFVNDDEATCLEDVGYLVSGPSSGANEGGCSSDRSCDALLTLVRADARRPCDVRDMAAEIVDDHELVELQEYFAPNIVCALARLDGHVVGIVANHPNVKAGVLDISASEKAARFVRTCDAFNIPLVTLVDLPGSLPGVDQEQGGVIRHGAKLPYAPTARPPSPGSRWCCGRPTAGAYIVMDSRSIGADLSFAWPGNEIAVMGPDAGADVIFHRELAQSPDPGELGESLGRRYSEELTHPLHGRARLDRRGDRSEGHQEGAGRRSREAPDKADGGAGAQARQPAPVRGHAAPAVTSELPVLSAAIRAEVTELCCEVLDLEPFEITRTTPLQRYRWRHRRPAEALAATLECAFGVTFEPAQVAAMVDLEQVCAELERALQRKRRSRSGLAAAAGDAA